jgi:hypothetical protein
MAHYYYNALLISAIEPTLVLINLIILARYESVPFVHLSSTCTPPFPRNSSALYFV